MIDRYPDMAQGAVRNIGYDWTAFLASLTGTPSCTSATVSADPSTGITFGSTSTTSDVSTVEITIASDAPIGEILIKWTGTLSDGETEIRSFPMSIKEHKLNT